MSTSTYRLTLIGCTLAWFLVGMHLPALHAMTHHGHGPQWTVLGATLALAVAGVVALSALLRAPGRGTPS